MKSTKITTRNLILFIVIFIILLFVLYIYKYGLKSLFSHELLQNYKFNILDDEASNKFEKNMNNKLNNKLNKAIFKKLNNKNNNNNINNNKNNDENFNDLLEYNKKISLNDDDKINYLLPVPGTIFTEDDTLVNNWYNINPETSTTNKFYKSGYISTSESDLNSKFNNEIDNLDLSSITSKIDKAYSIAYNMLEKKYNNTTLQEYPVNILS
jgi:predicted subunit of tRNA(5-methylaminomethyl-2-thiouridylate) methyltransferase